MPVILDFHYVDELIAQRHAQHGWYQGAPRKLPSGYREGESINRSCIAMISAQLQAYIEEVFVEVSANILPALVDRESYAKSISRWGNPSDTNINQLFLRIGIGKVLTGLSWQNCPQTSVALKLRQINELRNGIAHGKKSLMVGGKPFPLSLVTVENYRKFCGAFSNRFEAHALARAQNL